MAPVAAAPVGPGRRGPAPGGLDAPAVRLTGGALLGAGFILAFANFMVVLDMTIANVSVPNIAGGLGVSANQGTWVITSYAVAEAITVPLTGWLAQRFGAVRTFVTAMAFFGLVSALCGVAHSLGVLVVFRVLQGLAGGPMMPLSQTLLLRVFPKEQAGKAMGLWAMTTVVGPIAGPILGGLICDNYSWPWVFFINVPFAALFAFLASRMLAGQETQTKRLPIDFTGLAIMIVWIGALQIMLDQGEDLDWFNSPFIVCLLIVTIIGFV
jgi:DHA2 family multidrug resistance protein